MTPDGSVQWLVGTYGWGEIFFAEETEPDIRQLAKLVADDKARKIEGAEVIHATGKDGVVWRVGDIVLKHYMSTVASDALLAMKACVTLATGLERIDAHVGAMPLRTPSYYALARPRREWLDTRADAAAMSHIAGRHPTTEEDAATRADRQVLYKEAIAACGGNGDYYIFDDELRNLIMGDDGAMYKIDTDMH
jgi:hypothetical protein